MTIETGIYAGDELIQFEKMDVPRTTISMYLPKSFMVLPELMKDVKYPSKNGPDFIACSWNTAVSFTFKQLAMKVGKGGPKKLGLKSQQILKNINPSIRIRQQGEWSTDAGNDSYWFEYNGYQTDGQSYNQVCLISLKAHLLYSTFTCLKEDKENWRDIAKLLFHTVKETGNKSNQKL